MPKEITPAKRNSDKKRELSRVRRRYKVDVTKRRKFLPGEEAHLADMVIVLRLAGYTPTQIASTIGISRGQTRELLKRPDVGEKLALLREKLPQAALELLQGYMIEAVQALVYVLRTSSDSKYIIQAAGDILDRAGLPKASKQERHTVSEERTTITDDGIVERLRQASPEIQEEAAQLIERLEVLLAVEAETRTEEEVDGNDE